MTHHTPPVFPNCPQLETINAQNYFYTRQTIYFAVYLCDYATNHQIQVKIKRPDNSIANSWTHQPGRFYTASYWYWTMIVTAGMPSGEWTFEATFEGSTQSHKFYLNVDPASVDGIPENQKLAIYPNPNHGEFVVSGLKDEEQTVEIFDLSGKVTYKNNITAEKGTINLKINAVSGQYILQIKDNKGNRKNGKVLIK